MMKKLFTLLLAAACFTASAQIEVEYPYNPDNQNDGHVGIEDILEILTVYGEEFTPEQLMVEGTSLTEWIQLLSETVIQQQAQIDSLESSIQLPAVSDSLINDIYDLIAQQQTVIDSVVQQPLGSFSLGLAVDPPWPDFEGGSSVYWEEGTWDNDVWLEGVTGNVNSGWAYYYTPTEDGFLMGRAYTRFFIQQIDQNGAERPIVNIYSVPDAPSFCVPLVKGVNYRVIRQSTLFDLSWTPILASESQSSSDDSQSAGSLGPCQGEFTVNYHGYDYELVEIGGKCWFAEDLQTAHFTNDDQIAFAPDINYSVANSVGVPVYALAFDQNSEQNGEYGKLYNYPAVLDPRGLCPSGWIVSSADNWEDLKGWVSINTWFPNANALKSESDWSPPSNGLDLFGFNAKPSGHYTQGACYGGQQANSIGIWWTSTESNVSGQTYIMESDYDEINSYDGGCSPNVCFAVRCVKD